MNFMFTLILNQPNGPYTGFQISFQSKVFIRNSNSSILLLNHYKFSVNILGLVADLFSFFFTQEPLFIWNSAFRYQCHTFPNFALTQTILREMIIISICMPGVSLPGLLMNKGL